MIHFLGAATLGYLAVTGLATNGLVVARGLMRAGKHLLAGECDKAAVEALATVAAPAVMTFTAAANLVDDVVEGAAELFDGVLANSQREIGLEAENEKVLSFPRKANGNHS